MSIYDIAVRTIEGRETTLREFAGKALLIVNVASKCGYTPQYTGLEALWQKYRNRGLVILGFPCDQFGNQEPGADAEIATFCKTTYDVTFPLFSKIEVNGDGAHPLYRHLKHAAPGLLGSEAIKWNFTKFLVDARGDVVKRYGSRDEPAALAADIESVLPRAAA
jgi:glutathione peroxidase